MMNCLKTIIQTTDTSDLVKKKLTITHKLKKLKKKNTQAW